MPNIRKPEGERQRRNKQPKDVVLPESGREDVPSWPPEWDMKFTENCEAEHIWDRLWREPVAVMWSSADRDAIARYCVLTAELLADDVRNDKLLGRLAQLEDRYGLNAKARHSLRWLEAKHNPEVIKPKPQARRLKVVD